MKTILIPVVSGPVNMPGNVPFGPTQYLRGVDVVTVREVPDNFMVPPVREVLAGSLQDLLAAGTLVAAPIPLCVARNKMLRETDADFRKSISSGIVVGGITLRAGDADRNAFSQLLVMLAEAERAGALPETTTLADMAGALHIMPTNAARLLLLSYGSQYQSLWTARGQRVSSINAATTAEALSAI